MGQIPIEVIKIVKLKFNFDALQIPENLQEACVGVLWNRPHEDAVEQVGKVCEALFRFPEFQAWFAPVFDKRVKVCLADLLETSDWRSTPGWPVREWKVTPEAAAWMEQNLPQAPNESECYYDCYESRDSMTGASTANATTADCSGTDIASTMVSAPLSVQPTFQARTDDIAEGAM